MQQCFVEQGGLLEDLSIYLYPVHIPLVIREPIKGFVDERFINLDFVWTVAGVSPQCFTF